MRKQEKKFQVGNFLFSVESPVDFIYPENFLLYERKEENCDYFYKIEYVSALPEIHGSMIAERPDLLVWKENGLERRLIGVKGSPEPYALYVEENESSSHIYFLHDQTEHLHIDPVFTSLFALERRMLDRSALILHSAYINYQGEAILFSAPSGTGKSTQADLWKQYQGAEIINGDRSLLQCIGGRWLARGWPVCGSSEICHNTDTTIRCIVTLDQSQDGKNHIDLMKPGDAFRRLYSQITVNGWNVASVNRGIDLLSDLLSQVPVYHLSATISKEAVDTLHQLLG